jgi:putative FmdB family regulatory protein
MPRYDYECSNCGYKLEDVFQSITDKPLKKCKNCNKEKLERVIFAPHVYVRGEATTIGQLAERNSEKMGKLQIQEKTLQDKESKKQALSEAKKEINSKINRLTDKQKRRYIEDGKI